MNENIAILTVTMPDELRKRTRAVAKKLGITSTQLARDAITERLDMIEAKQRAAEERARTERETARAEREQRRRLRTLRNIGENQPTSISPIAANETAATTEKDDLDPLYERHARLVLAAIDQPIEKRLREAETISAIKKQCPLTYPPDIEILTRLDRAVMKLMSEKPKKRARDDAAPGEAESDARAIDPSKAQTFGDVVADEE